MIMYRQRWTTTPIWLPSNTQSDMTASKNGGPEEGFCWTLIPRARCVSIPSQFVNRIREMIGSDPPVAFIPKQVFVPVPSNAMSASVTPRRPFRRNIALVFWV